MLAGLSWRGVVWAFTSPDAWYGFPLDWLSHMLDVQLFGPSPGAHHLVNVLLHALNVALVYRVLARHDGDARAQRRRRGALRGPPAARGGGGLDLRAKGAALHASRPAHALGLRQVCAAPERAAVRPRRPGLRREPAGEADVGDAALPAPSARRVATAASRGLAAPRAREGAAARHRGRDVRRGAPRPAARRCAAGHRALLRIASRLRPRVVRALPREGALAVLAVRALPAPGSESPWLAGGGRGGAARRGHRARASGRRGGVPGSRSDGCGSPACWCR